MGSKKLLALIKWVGGVDDKTYTYGINVDHIKNFNYEKFQSDEEDPDKIYVVEWHDSPKEPLGGWLCYNAKIIAVSGSLAILNKKLKAFDGIQSPKRIYDKATAESEDIERVNKLNTQNSSNDDLPTEEISSDGGDISPKAKRQKLFEKTADGSINFDDKDYLYNENDKGEEQNNNSDVEFLNDDYVRDERRNPLSKTVPILHARSHHLNAKDQVTEINNDSSVDKSSQFVTKEDVEKALTNVLKNVMSTLSSSTSSFGTSVEPKSSKTNRHRLTSQDTKELGEPGSKVFVTASQYSAAESTATFTAITTSLLVSVFPHDVLIVSNYKGGAAKNAKDKTIKHKSLDENKLNAIRETVKHRFKKQFSETEFGRCINVKCNKLRYADRTSKNATQKKSDDDSLDKNQKTGEDKNSTKVDKE